MKKKFDTKLTLNLNQEMYASLMLEAGGIAKEIPNLIREKIEKSYLSKIDAKRLLAQQELTVKILIEVMRTLVLPTTIAAAQMDAADPKKKEYLTQVFEEQMRKQIDKIGRLNQEAGL